MTDMWLNIGAENGAARLLFRSVNGTRGVGLSQIWMQMEVSATHQIAVGCPLWLSGRVEVHGIGAASGYLAPLHASDRALTPLPLGRSQVFTMTADIGRQQLQVIEEHRNTNGLMLRVYLSGETFRDGQYETVFGGSMDYQLTQSAWITLLEQVGYRRVLLIELDALNAQMHPELAAAIDYFNQAERRYLEGEWRLTVESLRQCLAALIGQKPDEEQDQAAEVGTALKNAANQARRVGIGYGPRYELVRRALKFLCDLAAHPGAEETRRHHAHSALIMVGGLLQGWREP